MKYVDKCHTARPVTGDNIKLRRKDALRMSDNKARVQANTQNV